MAYQMNEAEAKLVEALRSGRYKQGKGSLRYVDAFCCLGVACDVIGGSDGWDGEDRYWGSFTIGLPGEIRQLLGWERGNGLLRGHTAADPRGCLTNINDGDGSFSEIADIIERGDVLHVGEV